jgi:hypothetical protein
MTKKPGHTERPGAGMGQGYGGGAPSKITKKWCNEKAKTLESLWENGACLAEVCKDLGICFDSYQKACRISDKFNEASKIGKISSEVWWTRLGQAGAIGKQDVSPAIWIFNMKNRFKWKDKIEQEINATTTNENLNVNVRAKDSDVEAAIERIKNQLIDEDYIDDD